MFGPAGHAYIYLIYGMYYCLNIVTEGEGYPAAVLLRAIEPLEGIDMATNGPGKLCRALMIDGSLNGTDMTGDVLFVEDCGGPPPATESGPRIGVSYAGEWANLPWRFHVKDSAFVSRPSKR
jgi:DNA-3-methyladenine glycosylase